MTTPDDKSTLPADHEQRELILTCLDENMLVEAAAGTGKTTSMVGRMVALVRGGRCSVDTLAAVTFTRKAAAELRARFQVALERAAGEAPGGEEADRLAQAVRDIGRCLIGTIHSFCGRLLRERPVEAGVDVEFREAEERENGWLRKEAWDQFVAKLYADDDPVLAELEEVGLLPGQLKAAFGDFSEYGDVGDWPAPPVELPDLAPNRGALLEYVDRITPMIPTFPPDTGNDELMSTYRRVHNLSYQLDLSTPIGIMEMLEACKKVPVVQKKWPNGPAQGHHEKEKWEEFRTTWVDPALQRWREYRYERVLGVLTRASQAFEQSRRAAGVLSFQDLLLLAARLLRDKPHVRSYFRRRFTHLLVDEFQDTDPIQAEVMLLLTADDPTEVDWRRCRPTPGSLFVVGDPKQSIYRFRRADIVTYNQVKKIIADSGGRTVSLSTNFRSVPEIVDWVNRVSGTFFPDQATEHGPANVPLQDGRQAACGGEFCGLRTVRVPGALTKNEDVVPFDASSIARFIRDAMDRGMELPCTEREAGAKREIEARPGDFLILARGKKHLADYARQLAKLGIPHQVTGGSALNQVAELAMLHRCLAAATRPHDPVALVSTLRSELFGISDQTLWEFRHHGGTFNYRSPIPTGLTSEHVDPLADAFGRLQRYASWLSGVSPVAAIEAIVADLGLAVSACAATGGDAQAGAVFKAIELLREACVDKWTADDLVQYLGDLVEAGARARAGEPTGQDEVHDGVPVRPHEEATVRLMNLHKAKGLEAPVVFLADPTGEYNPPPTLHVDRSEEVVRGYLAICGERRGKGSRPLLALPQGWDGLAKKENKFVDAESKRLLYVAITRAGAALIVSQRDHGNRWNPWSQLAPFLESEGVLPDPGEQAPPPLEQRTVTADDIATAREAILRRRRTLVTPTYAIGAAKEIALAGSAFPSRAGGEGAAWGSLVHLLLETAIKKPNAPLRDLARAAIEDQELPAQLLDPAVEVSRRVTKSGIWQRALASDRRLAEVPIQLILPSGKGSGPIPTVVRSVIDLVFHESQGWVIVDYKTDSISPGQAKAVAEGYANQVRAYGDTWRQLTGECVAEIGIYFTKTDQYIEYSSS